MNTIFYLLVLNFKLSMDLSQLVLLLVYLNFNFLTFFTYGKKLIFI